MKKSLLALFIFSLVSYGSNAQSAAKAVYAELGGPGIASINYDMRFSKTEGGFGFRAGVGGFRIDQVGLVFIPLGLNYITSKDSKHYFEAGAGVTIVNASGDFVDAEGTFNTTFGHLNIGYRLQPKEGGLFFRAAINPVFGKGFFIPYYAGIAFGYKF